MNSKTTLTQNISISRQLLPIFLCLTAATPAPQDNSEITYVKIQPVTDGPIPFTESRIDNLPATNNTRNLQENTSKIADVKEETPETTETYVEATTTERYASDEIIEETVDYESRTKAPSPRFLSKLSYFQKQDVGNSITTNLVERGGKRRFKSKCRCEKIWNCPKLQITVPRCPNEYFLCCF